MPDYIRSLRELIGHRRIIHPAARIIIENDAGEILLIRRKDNDKWGLIAGAFEEGENIRECMIREVEEETGLQLNDLERNRFEHKARKRNRKIPERRPSSVLYRSILQQSMVGGVDTKYL